MNFKYKLIAPSNRSKTYNNQQLILNRATLTMIQTVFYTIPFLENFVRDQHNFIYSRLLRKVVGSWNPQTNEYVLEGNYVLSIVFNNDPTTRVIEFTPMDGGRSYDSPNRRSQPHSFFDIEHDENNSHHSTYEPLEDGDDLQYFRFTNTNHFTSDSVGRVYFEETDLCVGFLRALTILTFGPSGNNHLVSHSNEIILFPQYSNYQQLVPRRVTTSIFTYVPLRLAITADEPQQQQQQPNHQEQGRFNWD